METVEVMIRISKQDFDFIKDEFADGDIPDEKDLKETTYFAIANGTVLPKGHGRLFILDEEKAKKYLTNFSFSCQSWISEVGISEATLKVIEADKEEKND